MVLLEGRRWRATAILGLPPFVVVKKVIEDTCVWWLLERTSRHSILAFHGQTLWLGLPLNERNGLWLCDVRSLQNDAPNALEHRGMAN